MTSRTTTTAKIPIAPALLNEAKLNFQRKIKEFQAYYEIPEALIINFNQTLYVYTGKRTYHTPGASTCLYFEKEKKITGTYTITTCLGSFYQCNLSIKGPRIVLC